MNKQLQQKLRELPFLDESEPILSFVQVVDFIKQQSLVKKLTKEDLAAFLPQQNLKIYSLLATIKTADNDSTPLIYLLKNNEKNNDYKLKVTWNLSEIKQIKKLDEKLKTTNSALDVYAFELAFGNVSSNSSSNDDERRFVWQCETQKDRDEFLNTLWKLSEQFLKTSDRPKFINFKFENKSSSDANSTVIDTTDNKTSDLGQQSYEISKTDEESLLKLMSECDFASSNAEMFMQKLQNELLDLDTSNIESIMNSEENTLKLIDMLDKAVDEIEKIDTRLKAYEDKISAVGDAVRIVGERDNVIQLQQNNQHALMDLLDALVNSIEFPHEYKTVLIECNLSSHQHVSRCVTAANSLIEILETDLPSGLKMMKAYEEQKKHLDHLKLRFCNNAYNHLKNAIGHTTNKHLESYKIVDNTLNSLPGHKQIHEELGVFRELMPWIHRSGCSFHDHDQRKTYFNDLKQNYIDTVKQLYLREIVPFCSCAKAKIIKNDKPKATGSMENLKGSLIRSLDKSHSNDVFSIKIDQQSKETLKLVFIKLLNQLSSAVQNEQQFCQEFFNIKPIKLDDTSMHSSQQDNKLPRATSSTSLASTGTNNSKQSSIESKNDLLALSEIFANTIEEQVKSTIECIIKMENLMVVFVYSDLLYRVLVSHNNKQYMHQPLVALLRTAKEKCDEFVNQIKEAIREYKVNKREKIGILKYVSFFEEFVKEAEVCWEPIKKEMYEKLCIIYQIIVNEIFKGIEAIANESQKTPPDVVRFQNYHQMNHIMRSINGLKESTKYARDQYLNWKASYVKEHFGRPLEKLHNFFEKVDAKIVRGCKHEDISYQLDLSANNLRDVIREYPAKEIKKGLDNLYSKVVEKHLVENSSLIEVVWRDMSDEFIRQYKNYEHLIKLCYPGHKISLEFTEQDICKFFEDIARSH